METREREIRESHHNNVTLRGIIKEIEEDDQDDVDEKILCYDPTFITSQLAVTCSILTSFLPSSTPPYNFAFFTHIFFHRRVRCSSSSGIVASPGKNHHQEHDEEEKD